MHLWLKSRLHAKLDKELTAIAETAKLPPKYIQNHQRALRDMQKLGEYFRKPWFNKEEVDEFRQFATTHRYV